MNPVRLNKFIAKSSNYSRRKADELIMLGHVLVNSQRVLTLGDKIDLQTDIIKINGKIIRPKKEKIYIALHKPAGYVTTRKDELNRKTIMELIPKNKNLKPAGRLDKDTEGLLLLSNDGDFIHQFTHPSFECDKEYFAEIKGVLRPEEKRLLEKGIALDGKKTAPSRIKILKISKNETTLTIEVHEGRKRQIRKMFSYLSHPVKYLKRLRIDKIKLAKLEKGKYRFLTAKELDAYKLT